MATAEPNPTLQLCPGDRGADSECALVRGVEFRVGVGPKGRIPSGVVKGRGFQVALVKRGADSEWRLVKWGGFPSGVGKTGRISEWRFCGQMGRIPSGVRCQKGRIPSGVSLVKGGRIRVALVQKAMGLREFFRKRLVATAGLGSRVGLPALQCCSEICLQKSKSIGSDQAAQQLQQQRGLERPSSELKVRQKPRGARHHPGMSAKAAAFRIEALMKLRQQPRPPKKRKWMDRSEMRLDAGPAPVNLSVPLLPQLEPRCGCSPCVRLLFSGLLERCRYHVLMDLPAVDDCRYRYAYHRSAWTVRAAPIPEAPLRCFLHPDGPFTGEQLMRQAVSFEKLKLTNNTADKGQAPHSPHAAAEPRHGRPRLAATKSRQAASARSIGSSCCRDRLHRRDPPTRTSWSELNEFKCLMRLFRTFHSLYNQAEDREDPRLPRDSGTPPGPPPMTGADGGGGGCGMDEPQPDEAPQLPAAIDLPPLHWGLPPLQRQQAKMR
uniref:T-box domain-containing protein n=1 Tax=Macrostomum lignano TaxID=282301 RepID=A0A1I8F374_9PLAT